MTATNTLKDHARVAGAMTPTALSELVPASTLAKALLEAEATLEGIERICKDDMREPDWSGNQPHISEICRSSLAQIQRIKKGEIV